MTTTPSPEQRLNEALTLLEQYQSIWGIATELRDTAEERLERARAAVVQHEDNLLEREVNHGCLRTAANKEERALQTRLFLAREQRYNTEYAAALRELASAQHDYRSHVTRERTAAKQVEAMLVKIQAFTAQVRLQAAQLDAHTLEDSR